MAQGANAAEPALQAQTLGALCCSPAPKSHATALEKDPIPPARKRIGLGPRSACWRLCLRSFPCQTSCRGKTYGCLRIRVQDHMHTHDCGLHWQENQRLSFLRNKVNKRRAFCGINRGWSPRQLSLTRGRMRKRRGIT